MQIKLLFDQNLSYKLCEMLSSEFPDSSQLKLLNLDSATDKTVWDFAKENGYVLVSQDNDFYHFSMVYGVPPKLIWLRCGNKPTKYIAELLKNSRDKIMEFATKDDIDCLEIC